MLIKHILMHIVLRAVDRIKNYALSALLLDVEICIGCNGVAVRYLTRNDNGVELAHSLVAYVIVVSLGIPIAEATVHYGTGVLVHSVARCELVTVANVEVVAVTLIVETDGLLASCTCKRVEVTENVSLTGLGATNTVSDKINTHIGDGIVGSLDENAYRVWLISTRNVAVVNVCPGCAKLVVALENVNSAG
jgi:hypothetical protein